MKRIPAPEWTGRDDGPGSEHRRWYNAVSTTGEYAGATVLVGLASDEGVRRNLGRPGAIEGPTALRNALGTMSLHRDINIIDAGDVMVDGQDLESGQTAYAETVSEAIASGAFTVGLGGGHEISWASYMGVRGATDKALGVLNLDAHFDLRTADQPTSGTGFLQMAQAEQAAGHNFNYAVVGIAETSNTPVLFNTADELGVRYLLDTDARVDKLPQVTGFITEFINSVDVLYLTVDLDVLPASVAPGVSAPAGRGVTLEVISEAITLAAASGKLIHIDFAELNPALDIDSRTARTAARLINDAVTAHPKNKG